MICSIKTQIDSQPLVPEDLRLHNEALKEFVTLQYSLPNFGIWQDAVVNWVHYMSMVLSGWKNISSKLERYNTMEFPNATELREKLNRV